MCETPLRHCHNTEQSNKLTLPMEFISLCVKYPPHAPNTSSAALDVAETAI